MNRLVICNLIKVLSIIVYILYLYNIIISNSIKYYSLYMNNINIDYTKIC